MEPALVVKEKQSISGTLVLLVGGVALLYVGGRALLDPAFPGAIKGGKWITLMRLMFDNLPHTVAGLLVLLVGGILLVFGAVLAHSILWPETIATIDAAGIERVGSEGQGRLAWNDITGIRLVDKSLQIEGRRIDQPLVVPLEDIDATQERITREIRHHRPDLELRAA